LKAADRGENTLVEAEWAVMGGIYALGALALLAFLSLYRLSAKDEILASLLSPWGIVLVGTIVVGMLVMFIVGRSCCRQWREGSMRLLLNVTMNVLVLVTIGLTTELALRYLVVHRTYDDEIGEVKLYPRQWEKVTAAYTAVLDKAEAVSPYLVSSQSLGWTIGPSRKSENAMYFSSVEGLRSAAQGTSVKDDTYTCRIALIGDSFTFGEAVHYKDTWGFILGERLGGRCQILNFGVIGYGIDQAYLRYLQDVRPWHPDLVIFSFINDDLRRAVSIYGFLEFPDGRFPFTKPRFLLKGNQLELMTLPSALPRDTFASVSIHDLPSISHDVGYAPLQWDRAGWEWVTRSYVLRLLISLYPLHDRERPEVSRSATMELNATLILNLRQAILDDGAKALIVFLPDQHDLSHNVKEGLSLQLLRMIKIPYVNVAPCMKSSPIEGLFNPPSLGGHYSPKGNREAANCLFQEVNSNLGERFS